MTIDEYEEALERIERFVDELCKSHPDLGTHSEEFQRGYKRAMVDRFGFEQLGSRPEITLKKR